MFKLSDIHGRHVGKDGIPTFDLEDVMLFKTPKEATAYRNEHKSEIKRFYAIYYTDFDSISISKGCKERRMDMQEKIKDSYAQYVARVEDSATKVLGVIRVRYDHEFLTAKKHIIAVLKLDASSVSDKLFLEDLIMYMKKNRMIVTEPAVDDDGMFSGRGYAPYDMSYVTLNKEAL